MSKISNKMNKIQINHNANKNSNKCKKSGQNK